MSTEILNEKEARRVLGVSPSTMNRLRDEGRLGFYKIGPRKIAYSPEHIQEFLKNSEHKPTNGNGK